ncbi:hypothetical protein CHS0354_000957 [Potamilus streckersoni]|uniref:USP domain-containing protein n=1 Tax=Potamilus streckersoni TaxID=2493646 RepID=A0AAE0W2L5_9BIVA|nr:hypothetical protein CHS0354_000957 [Potamilus streckersoni]
MIEKQNSSVCDQCSKAGRKGRLKTCQINFTEAVTICTNALCSFGLDGGETLSRSLSEIILKGKSKDGLCTTIQSTSTSHAKSCFPSAGSISLTGPCIQTSKQPPSSVTSTTWGSLHTGLPGVKNLGKDQIIQNFLHQLPLTGKSLCNVGKLEGKYKSTALESFSNQENPNSLSATKSFTKLKLKHGFKGFQFNKKDKTLSDEGKRKLTEICINKSSSEKNALSDQSSYVNKNDKIKMSSSLNSSSSQFSVIKNASNCKHITNCKDVFTNSTPDSKRKTTFAQSDQLPENSNECKRFLQWQNKDALCWLDVVLCLLVHNQTLVNLLKDNRCPKESVIFTLLKAYHQAQDLINGKKKCLKRNSPDSAFVQSVLSSTHSKTETASFSRGQGQTDSSGLTFTSMQTGAGNSPSSLGMLGESLYECPDLASACKTLEDVREAVWQRLQSKLKCEKGRNDSPVLAFSALVQETLEVKAQFQMRYRFSYTCLGCGEVEESIHENILPSFPNVPVSFNIEKPAHVRKCMKCQQESSRAMTYERLPNTLVMHFAEGLPYNNFTALDLKFQDDYYVVKGVIRYTNNPDHFTAWIRNETDDTWMECDDLKSPICSFLPEPPNFPPQEIHILMWEKTVHLGGCAAKLTSRNPLNCKTINATTQLDCQGTNATSQIDCPSTKLDHLLSVCSHSNSLGKPVLDDQTSKVGKQHTDAQIFRKGGLYKGNSCNSGKPGMEAGSAKLAVQSSFPSDAKFNSKPCILQKPAEPTLAVGTSGHFSSNLFTCKCAQSSDVCVCDQTGNELPRFISTAFNRQTLLKPTPLHFVNEILKSSAPNQNSVPVINSMITNDLKKFLETERHTISKVSEKSVGLGLQMSVANAAAILSRNASENKHSDSGFTLVSKAENMNKAVHFSVTSGANTSVPVSNNSCAPTKPEINAISLLRSLRKQRESKVNHQLTGRFKPSGFFASRNCLKEGNVKSENGDLVSKEINVPANKAGKDSSKPSGTEQFLSTFGKGRGHGYIGSKFEGLKLLARNNLEVNLTSAMTDSRMASPISSLCSEPVNKKQATKRLGKQKTIKPSQSTFEGLQILSRNTTQSFDSEERTACNYKGANISIGHGRKKKRDVAEEKVSRSPVEKDLNLVLDECRTKNIAGVNDKNSNLMSQNSTGGVHIIQIDGEEAKNSNYLSDILSKFREHNSVTKSTVIIIQNQSNKQERKNSSESNDDIALGQPLGSKRSDSEQNGKENKLSPIKTNNGPSLLKSFNLDLANDFPETENSSPSKKRKIEKEECDILQDLYQALNIPLSEVGNAMSEIVSDVAADMDAIDPFGLNLDTSLQGCAENEEDNKA